MRTLLLICLALLAAPGDSIAAAPADAADMAALRELKQVLWPRAYATQDTRLLDRILDDGFQSVDDEGRWSTKAEELAWITEHKPGYDRFDFEIRRLDVFDGHTAIVAGTGTIRGKDENGAYVIEYQSSNVFVKRDGAWRAVASHVSGSRRK